MAPRPHIKEFKTKVGDENPFKTGKGGLGPSGSNWTTKELNWLAVQFQDGCEIKDVFSPETELSGRIADFIRSELRADSGLDWDQLREIGFNAGDIYPCLFFLETRQEKQPYYSPSAVTSTQASSALKDPQSQRGGSPKSEASSAYNRQVSLTPTPRPVSLKTHEQPRMFPIGSSPLGPNPSELPKVRKATRASKRALITRNLFGVKPSAKPLSEADFQPINPSSQLASKHAAAAAGSPSKSSSPKGVSFLATPYPPWETSSDTAYTAHSSQPSESESDSNSDGNDEEEEEEEEDVYDAEDDKPENDVVSAARAFLNLIESAFKSVVQNLPLDTKDSRTLDLLIGGVRMTSHPDISLRLATKTSDKKDPEIEVVVECKRKNNKLSVNRKLGQECSELLGEVKRLWAFGKPRETYTAYLVSWHHLEYYVSRLDVSKEYLDKLDKDTRRLQEGPRPLIKRSRRFDLTNTDHRVQFGLLVAHLLIHQMTMYGRQKELVKRLLK